MKTLTVLLSFCLFGFSLAEYLSLDGNQWQAISFNKTIKCKAKVPGSIYSDLRRKNILKQSLLFGNNDLNYRWVSYDNWTFERTFNVDSSLLSKKNVHLVANGIDTVSSVYINDQLIGKTENMFIRYKFEVKDKLKIGRNSIRIAFTSAPIYSKQKEAEYKRKYNYTVPPGCDPLMKFDSGECDVNYIRKMAASYSWDWGPAFPTQGIWKPIGIEAYDKAIIRDITVETIPEPKNSSDWTLNVKAYIESAKSEKLETIFDIELDENKLITKQKKVFTSVSNGTIAWFRIPIHSIRIIPWFPNGVSNDTQKLYRLKVKLSFSDSAEVSEQTKRIGFRKIELIQTPIQPKGLTFYFSANGVPFFAKGTNWIPANVLMEDISPEYLRHLMVSAKEANMNMMRVWGGGVYESDLFYDLADELGITIWQDFMFADAMYPTNAEFLQSVDTEIKTQVRRLQHHPSIAVWAGNNENEWALSIFAANDQRIRSDYRLLYVTHIAHILQIEDKSRPYLTSSPSNGLTAVLDNYTSSNPNDWRFGDVHFYNYSIANWDWTRYPSGKFVSEYGYQSYPSMQSMVKAFEDKDLVYPVSKAVQHHQRQRFDDGTKVLERMIAVYFKLPSNGGKERLNDLIYLSQISQAMAQKVQTELYRRNRAIDPKTGSGMTMGALYWQLNDIWQGPTWASIEFGGKWKILHNYVERFFDNLLVSPYEDSNQTLKVSLVRDDYLGELQFNYSIKVYKWLQTKSVHAIQGVTKTKSFSANSIYSQSIPELIQTSKCVDRSECVLHFEVSNTEHKLKANNFLLLTEPKNSKLVKPNVKVVDVKKRSGLGSERHVFDIRLSAQAIAPFVSLDFKLNAGITGRFSNNGFFIFNGEKSIEFYPKSDSVVNEQQIKDNLIVKTVTDVV